MVEDQRGVFRGAIGPCPPLCELEKRFEHIQAMFQTYDVQFSPENWTKFE